MFSKKYYLIIPTNGPVTTASSLDFFGDFVVYNAFNFGTKAFVKKVYTFKTFINSVEEYDSWEAFDAAVKRRIQAVELAMQSRQAPEPKKILKKKKK
jgi:hypothetical protein